jgi:2-alkyl-3-oxoalkanoate reductase
MRIGIVGASGFVGNRAVEMLAADGNEVRSIVRSAASLERLSPQHLDGQIANCFDRSSLETAFAGCELIIHSILGSPGLIRGSILPTYQAAQRAGVRRIVYLSSMVVHTSAPALGTTEATPPITNQPFPTHNAKIAAERQLLQLRQQGEVEVTIFRPGIVFGPRSRWVEDLADRLSQGQPCLLDGSRGVCNTVYVDNLIHGIRLALSNPAADGEAFFVGDRESVSWYEFYQPFAAAFGVNLDRLPPAIATPATQLNWRQQRLETVRNSEFVQKVLSLVSDEFKQQFRGAVGQRQRGASEPMPPVPAAATTAPTMSEMMAILQRSPYRLSFTKATQLLGYEPIFSVWDGCDRSIEWLATIDRFQPILQSKVI